MILHPQQLPQQQRHIETPNDLTSELAVKHGTSWFFHSSTLQSSIITRLTFCRAYCPQELLQLLQGTAGWVVGAICVNKP